MVVYKLPGKQDSKATIEPTTLKIWNTKLMLGNYNLTLIQRFSSGTRQEFVGIMKLLDASDDSEVQVLAVEDNQEVGLLRGELSASILSFSQIQFFLEGASHAVLFQALVNLDLAVRQALEPEKCLLLCRTCLQTGGEVDKAGTFDLKRPLDSHLLCQHGHRLPPLDEQFFSGICKSYKRFHCAPNTTTDILNGAMKITCGDVGFAVDARLAKFQEFEEITNEMSSDSMVSQSILYLTLISNFFLLRSSFLDRFEWSSFHLHRCS